MACAIVRNILWITEEASGLKSGKPTAEVSPEMAREHPMKILGIDIAARREVIAGIVFSKRWKNIITAATGRNTSSARVMAVNPVIFGGANGPNGRNTLNVVKRRQRESAVEGAEGAERGAAVETVPDRNAEKRRILFPKNKWIQVTTTPKIMNPRRKNSESGLTVMGRASSRRAAAVDNEEGVVGLLDVRGETGRAPSGSSARRAPDFATGKHAAEYTSP